ncbi:SDR family oxidoreductase [Advenella mimigardefordensis]|uniref:Gluconate 5-dehydrogenase n=1 Tax=Advenella mimigardefordensis (strain DSM 17166 / LMG 22922 / DPN7) TaxID=1247726 RepID=W0PFD3_ADVMD|nr:SDR family oxidoreductase [Advenella mimigardefordensis]AHG64192.1 gluconate 5-dehydrogenase [Advenella mimigardefordensis DPN7]
MQQQSSYTDSFGLQDKVVFISGSTRGLGLEMASAMARSGALVYINGRSAQSVEQACARLQKSGAHVQGLVGDMSVVADIDRCMTDLAEQHGRCDVLVNNMGIRIRQPLAAFDFAQMEQMLQANLLGAMYLSQKAAALMRQQQWGRLITITSVAGEVARPGDGVYPITKQGLTGMMRALAVELATYGITSNAIAPGTFATETNLEMVNAEAGQTLAGRNPTGRWGRPEEIAGLAVFLASDLSGYINGQVIAVDGGLSVLF